MSDLLPPNPRIPLAPALSFDRVAAEYETTRHMPEAIADAMARLVSSGLGSGDWILDAGIGTGRVGRSLVARHSRTVGVDIAPQMMAQMRHHHHQYPAGSLPYLTLADVRALPFAEATFARVLALHLLHLISDWEQAVAEVWRVLQPGGRFFIGVEERTPTQVREHYLNLAQQRGLLPPHPGAHSREIIRFLEERGVLVTVHRLPELSWLQTIPILETLHALRCRTYSLLWEIPETDHQEMLTATEAFATARFGSWDQAETATVQVLLYLAIRPVSYGKAVRINSLS